MFTSYKIVLVRYLIILKKEEIYFMQKGKEKAFELDIWFDEIIEENNNSRKKDNWKRQKI